MAQKLNRYGSRRLTGTYISSIVCISLVLVMIGVGTVLLFNAKNVSDYFKEKMRVSVLLKPEVTEEEGAEFCQELKAEPFAADADFIDKSRGIEEMKDVLGEDFMEAFDSVPVPLSVDVYLASEYVVSDSLKSVEEHLAAYPIVDEVVCEDAQIEMMTANMAKIYLILGVLIAVLLFISTILINNMVRLNLYIKRYTVNTMQLVGATHWFIMKPYMKRAAIQGLVSSAVAMVILTAGLCLLKKSVPQIVSVSDHLLILEVAAVVISAGLLICLVSTYFVMRKLLSMTKDELYG